MAAAVEFTDNPQDLTVDDDYQSITGNSMLSDTSSITSSVLDYEFEHGRRYHSFRSGKYLLPNDENEQERLDMSHAGFVLMYGGTLLPPGVPEFKGPGRVLDAGTGTGIWAIDFGDTHPQMEVIGVDLSPIQPKWVPPNVRFDVDDLEDDWNFSRPFNLIHVRAMAGAFKDLDRFYKQCFDNLNPGGYLVVTDYDMSGLGCDDGSLKEGSSLDRYHKATWKAYQEMGLAKWRLEDYPRVIQNAGFTDVTAKRYKYPLGPWPKNKSQKHMGYLGFEVAKTGFESYGLKILTSQGYSAHEAKELFDGCVREADSSKSKIHSYWKAASITARKPR